MKNKVKKNTSKLSKTIDVYVDGRSSCFYTGGKKCQLIIFIHFPLFKYVIGRQHPPSNIYCPSTAQIQYLF